MPISSQALTSLIGQAPKRLAGANAGMQQLMSSIPNIQGSAGIGGAAAGILGGVGSTAASIRGLFGTGGTGSQINGRRDVLSAAQGRPDPLMNFNWFATMPDISPKNGQSYSLEWEYVEEATIPFVEFEQVSNYRAGKNFHYPNHNSIGTLSLKLYEDRFATATNSLKACQASMYNPATGLQYFPRDYKKTIVVTVLDVANQSVMVIDYMACWPMRFDQISLGSASSERVLMSAEFSVDEMNIKIGTFSESEMPSLLNTIGATFPAFPTAIPDVFPSNFVQFSF